MLRLACVEFSSATVLHSTAQFPHMKLTPRCCRFGNQTFYLNRVFFLFRPESEHQLRS